MFGRKKKLSKYPLNTGNYGPFGAVRPELHIDSSYANTATESREVVESTGPHGFVQVTNPNAVMLQDSYVMDYLPQGVIVKRIFARKSTNKWMVKYHSITTEYYATTLTGALGLLFKNHPALLEKYNANAAQASGPNE